MQMRTNPLHWNALVCLGLAWPMTGFGFSALMLNFVPTGASLVVLLAGLSLAGVISGGMLLIARGCLRSAVGRGWVTAGYAMFAPVALMGSLLAPGSLESGPGSPAGVAILAFLAIVVSASAAIGLGLAFTGGLAMAAHSVALRIHSSVLERKR